MVKYDCDAWGNHKVLDSNGKVNTSDSFIGNINPFRYKGYYYDKESNMYYCKSRYYVPEWCRWLNADSIGYLDPTNINGLNLFAYCYNNPVMWMDSAGCYPKCVLVGRYKIKFHNAHVNDGFSQKHVHIYRGNQKLGSRNFDGSIHDGVDYTPDKKVLDALKKYGWDWYGNKISFERPVDTNLEWFPNFNQHYDISIFNIQRVDNYLEYIPKTETYNKEIFGNYRVDLPSFNPFPSNEATSAILVIGGIIAIAAILLIPATGGASALAFAI